MFSKAASEGSNPSARDTSIFEIHAVADLVCYRRRQPPLARLFGFLRRQLERLRFRFFLECVENRPLIWRASKDSRQGSAAERKIDNR
jgi:hypothetical protein